MKTNIKALTLLLAVLLVSSYQRLMAQSLEPFSRYGDVSASAESFTMTRHGSLTPSLYTGAMTYCVPIYTYKDEDFEIPISLDYYFDGLKPSAASGLVGLGWTLDCGGVITRDVMATPDDEYFSDNQVFGYAHANRVSSSWSQSRERAVSENTDVGSNIMGSANFLSSEDAEIERDNFNPFAGVAVTWNTDDSDSFMPSGTKYDAMSDIYHFRMGDISGDFLLLDDLSVKVFNTSCPHGEIEVELMSVPMSSLIPSIAFKIRTGDGYEYTFGGCSDWADISKVDYSGSAGDTVSKPQITAWKLVSIKAPNGNLAEFLYSPEGYPQVNFTSTVSITPMRSGSAAFSDSWPNSRAISMIHGNFHHPLESIRVNGRTVAVFDYAVRPEGHEEDTRTERIQTYRVLSGISIRESIKSKNLQSISIYNVYGDVVERADLAYSYSGRKMFLESVSLLSKGRQSFEYDRSDFNFPSFDTTKYDHWGYFNLAAGYMSDLHKMIPLTSANDQEFSLYNLDPNNHFRDPDFRYSRKGALTAIIYPTGGRSEIEYEAHCASRVVDSRFFESPFIAANVRQVQPGGARVKSVTDRDSSGEITNSRHFTYVDGSGNSSGILLRMPRYAVFLEFIYARSRVGITGFTNDGTFCQTREGHIGYSKVQEHFPDGSVIEYEFSGYDNCPDDYDFEGVEMTISKKTGRYISYTVDDDNALDEADKFIGLTALPKIDRSTLRGKLIGKTTYESEGGRVLSRTSYSYSLSPVHTSDYYYNALLAIIEMPHTFYSPQLDTLTECTCFSDGSSVQNVTRYTRNSFGQVKSETLTSGDESTGMHYWYVHENGSTTFPALKSDAVMTRKLDGISYVVASERYTYGVDGGGFRPTMIESFICTPTRYYESAPSVSTGRSSDIRISTFAYDPTYRRLVSAQYPGGASIQYTWDRRWRHILSRTVNGDGNTFNYEWKDLVGLTRQTAPTGQYQSYTYDDRNRPQYIRDVNGKAVEKYEYHTNNE